MEDLTYRRFLDLYYKDEKPLTSDVVKLSRLVGMSDCQDVVERVLEDFFLLSDDGFRQKRADLEIGDFISKKISAEKNGRKGGVKKKQMAADGKFWRIYPKKVGKKTCVQKWRTLKLDAKADVIIADVKNRIANHRPWLDGYQPNPLTYLNGELWEDDIELRKSKNGNKIGDGKLTEPERIRRACAEAIQERAVEPETPQPASPENHGPIVDQDGRSVRG
jgi:uncharacterized protein YdaU (DUF1376 family)